MTASAPLQLQHFLFHLALNTIAYIFVIPFSLSLPLSFAIMEDEWQEEHTIYRLLIHAHHCRKKKSQFRGGLWVSAVHVRVWGGGVRGVVEGVGGTGHGNR